MLKKLLVLAAVLIMTAGMSAAAFADDAAAAATPAATAGTAVKGTTAGTAAIAAALDKATGTDSGPTVKVGGMVKMWIYDRVNGIGYNSGIQRDITRNMGTMFTEFDLSINAKINDMVGFIVEPKWGASTGATPKIGMTYTAATSSGITSAMAASDMGHGVAEMTLNLPYDITAEVGQLRPLYSMDYGAYMFADEEMTTGKVTHDILVFEDYGLGFGKTFSFGDLSLPANIYIVNGPDGDYKFENNNQPGVLLHIAPEYGPVTLWGSYFVSKYDAAERYAKQKGDVGLNFKWEALTIRAEYGVIKTERSVAANVDYLADGYYIKAFYRVLPWLQFMIHHDSANESLAKDYATRNNFVRYLTDTLGCEINLSDSTILQINCDIGNWTQSDRLKSTVFTSPNIAVRATF